MDCPECKHHLFGFKKPDQTPVQRHFALLPLGGGLFECPNCTGIYTVAEATDTRWLTDPMNHGHRRVDKRRDKGNAPVDLDLPEQAGG